MSPLEADTMVALHVEEILREHEADRLGWAGNHAVHIVVPESHADPPRLRQSVRLAIGEMLIRVGLWLTEGASASLARSQGTDRVNLGSYR